MDASPSLLSVGGPRQLGTAATRPQGPLPLGEGPPSQLLGRCRFPSGRAVYRYRPCRVSPKYDFTTGRSFEQELTTTLQDAAARRERRKNKSKWLKQGGVLNAAEARRMVRREEEKEAESLAKEL